MRFDPWSQDAHSLVGRQKNSEGLCLSLSFKVRVGINYLNKLEMKLVITLAILRLNYFCAFGDGRRTSINCRLCESCIVWEGVIKRFVQ